MKRSRRQDTNVSLFPFLAVLMCTMGALIVLLVVMVEQARVQAKSIVVESQPDRPTLEQQQDQIEMFQGQRQMLDVPRTGFVEELEDNRLRLTHVEDHLRTLHDELVQLRRQAAAIENSAKQKNIADRSQKDQLAKLKSKVRQSQQLLDRARGRARNRPRSYAIVPYDGQNGTSRRPIYVECFADRVVLQPEGTVLEARDFAGPGGAGNPLAAALRATREHWNLQRGTAGKTEPYPLLIVRPDAAEMYAMARNAMKSWGSDFGYELVADDLNLSYPAADPLLAQTQQKAIEAARRRKAAIARAAPRQFGGYSEPLLRASSQRGGFVLDGGSQGAAGSGRSRSGTEQGRHSAGGGAGQGTAKANGSTAAHANKRPLHNGQSQQGQPGNESGSPNRAQSGDSKNGHANGDGGMAQSPSQSKSSAGGRSSLAQTRGKNWGIPNSSRGATGFTRPIKVSLEKGKLTVYPESGTSGRPQVIVLEGSVEGQIDDFISAVWKHMDGWGIAGPNAYWKPVLNVNVAPDLHAEYAELGALLEGSGIRLERKTW